jgi:hypothetical protein
VLIKLIRQSTSTEAGRKYLGYRIWFKKQRKVRSGVYRENSFQNQGAQIELRDQMKVNACRFSCKKGLIGCSGTPHVPTGTTTAMHG